jgi:hypothetical protein
MKTKIIILVLGGNENGCLNMVFSFLSPTIPLQFSLHLLCSIQSP